MMRNAGAAGFVTDGPVRDYAGIVETRLPVWCSGLTPASPFTKGPGSVGFPVQIAGQEIETGDIIVADRDGIVVVPYERIDEVIANLAKVRDSEAELDAEVTAGLRVPPPSLSSCPAIKCTTSTDRLPRCRSLHRLRYREGCGVLAPVLRPAQLPRPG